eukprot:scaffold22701_cov123-Cylindrotheca_fusiformis.AAC.19
MDHADREGGDKPRIGQVKDDGDASCVETMRADNGSERKEEYLDKGQARGHLASTEIGNDSRVDDDINPTPESTDIQLLDESVASDREIIPPDSSGSRNTQTPFRSSASRHSSKTSPPKANRKRGIPHVYRDFSNIPDVAGFVRKKTGGVTQPFPEKLHDMLDNANEPTIVTWLPHGRAFLVKKPKIFTSQIMPKRITQGADAGAYYHELFLRGLPHLCMRMQRQKVKGTGHKQPADAQTEPDFYSMPPSEGQQNPVPLQRTPPAASTPSPTIYEDMSPGLRGVHGAAHLLKTIAAGLPGSAMKSPFSIGQQAAQEPTTASPIPNAHLPKTWPVSSKKDRSMSLLGRVTKADTSSVSTTGSPAMWPSSIASNAASSQNEDSSNGMPSQSKDQGSSTSDSANDGGTDESDAKDKVRSAATSSDLPAEKSKKEEPCAVPIRGGGKETFAHKTKGEKNKGPYSGKKTALQTGSKFQSRMSPKAREALFSQDIDLIENKVMRGIETEEA